MLAKGQLDDAISCSLRAIELNRNIPKAERDGGEVCPSGIRTCSCGVPAGPAAAPAMSKPKCPAC